MRKMKKIGSNRYAFILHREGKAMRTPSGGCRILLYPLRNLSVQSFAYPFAGLSKVRDALRIRFRPLLGEGAGDVSVIPFFVHTGKKSSSGSVCLLFGAETRDLEEELSAGQGDYLVWPAAFAFASEVEGSGVVILDEGCRITTVWFDDWTPRFYKVAGTSESSLEDEENALLALIAAEGESVEHLVRLKAKDLTDEEIQSCGERTLAACPSYGRLDLSGKGTNLLEKRERVAESLIGRMKKLVFAGAIFLFATLGIYLQRSLPELSDATPPDIYKYAFGEASAQPLASSAAKLRSAGSPVQDTSLLSTMRDITTVWNEAGSSGDIRLDTMKYGSDNVDIVGTAKNNESIQGVRTRMEKAGYVTKTDSIQKIQSGELRFNITLSRKGSAKGGKR